MKLFESRNVLDRIETTWSMFFSSAWQVRVLPQILFTLVGTVLGLLSLVPFFFVISDMTTWNTLDSAGQMFFLAKMLLISLIPITVFTLISGITYTYTLTVSHDFEEGKTWQEYARIAWLRLWGWAWYGLWTTLFIIAIIALGVFLYFSSTLLFGFFIPILILLFFWAIVPLYAGAPGYILENSWNPHRFFSIFSVTSQRWWRTLGNILLGSIIVTSVLGLVQQLIYWIMGIGSLESYFTGLNWQGHIDWISVFSGLPTDFGTRFIFGGLLLFILSSGQQVFVGMFQYIVWKEITTDISDDTFTEKKEE